ncbi:MAG: DUF2027 domain-containing protein, partial [Paludibacteraceae bacterium]|nr:DUF2027 domain-containing protein [Paludibacteraceae bacterium]
MAVNVKIGDKVRYLNSVGGGVVTRFQSKDIVLVEEEDGFETPCLVSQVVVVQETNKYNFPVEDPVKEVNEKKASKAGVKPQVEEEEEEEIKVPEYTWNERYETPDGEQLSVYLAFVPKDIKQLQTTDMELYIVNDSNYYLQFALYSGDGKQRVRCHNLVEPQTKLYLETINKIGLNDLEHLRFQGFAYKQIQFDAKPAMDIELKINPTKFYKLHSFRENDYFDEDAMLVTIVKNDVMDLGMLIDPQQLQKAISEKKHEEKKPVSKPQNQKPAIIEVDLHINQLIDNTNGLSRADMLNYQLEKFNKVMQENLKRKG